MYQCEIQQLDEVYQEHCEQNLNSTDKIVTFILRIIILIISILSSLFVLLIIRKSKKHQFWPFKLITMQVISELVDLTLALLFTINSSCWPNVCKYIAYIMHSNWLASLNFMLFQCFIYFCLIRSELLFNYIMNQLYYIIAFLYFAPYGILFYVLYDGGFGPSGWYLQNGEFNFIFCGFINSQLFGFWIIPVSSLFALSIIFSIFNYYYWYQLKNKKGLRYPALRIQSIILFPLLYSFAWIINFVIRMFDTNANNQNYCPTQKMNWAFYIFYLFLNLGFELHLTLGAILFYFIYKGLFGIDSIWDEFCLKKRQRLTSNQIYLTDATSNIQI